MVEQTNLRGILDEWICKIEKNMFLCYNKWKILQRPMQLLYSKHLNLHNYTLINVSNF